MGVKGGAGYVSLRLLNYDQYVTIPAPHDERIAKRLLYLLYPLTIALDAVTWPLQLVLAPFVNWAG